MLVLTRRTGQTILIGNDIRVTYLGSHGESARIGIDAPKDITILREEVRDRDIQNGDNNHG